ncbi:hypothetical protein EJD97_001362 [Solanum chilense]|uniref:Uncharacterized protein n=1 Tax=Solanum chilense TaxID=4083 RepID=A0A6N2C632_SOLCI|nr:hypothetical protein EJD97_001362 [Solanum chilense]
MNTRTNNSSRTDEENANEAVPPEAPKNPQGFHNDESPTLFGCKVEDDLQGLVEEVFKLLDSMEERLVREGLVSWASFKTTFLDRFFHLELRESKMELKRTRAEDENSSKARFEVQDKPSFKKKFSNQGPPNTQSTKKSKVSTPKPQEEKCGGSYVEKSIFAKFGRKPECKCLVGMGN